MEKKKSKSLSMSIILLSIISIIFFVVSFIEADNLTFRYVGFIGFSILLLIQGAGAIKVGERNLLNILCFSGGASMLVWSILSIFRII